MCNLHFWVHSEIVVSTKVKTECEEEETKTDQIELKSDFVVLIYQYVDSSVILKKPLSKYVG
jgi:hypothetical protein